MTGFQFMVDFFALIGFWFVVLISSGLVLAWVAWLFPEKANDIADVVLGQ